MNFDCNLQSSKFKAHANIFEKMFMLPLTSFQMVELDDEQILSLSSNNR